MGGDNLCIARDGKKGVANQNTESKFAANCGLKFDWKTKTQTDTLLCGKCGDTKGSDSCAPRASDAGKWWDSGERLIKCRNFKFPASATKYNEPLTMKEIGERDTDGGGNGADGITTFPAALDPGGGVLERLNNDLKAKHPSFQRLVVEHGLLPRLLQLDAQGRRNAARDVQGGVRRRLQERLLRQHSGGELRRRPLLGRKLLPAVGRHVQGGVRALSAVAAAGDHVQPGGHGDGRLREVVAATR